MYVEFRLLVVGLLLAWSAFSYSWASGVMGNIVGACDDSDECFAHVKDGLIDKKLCDASDLSVFWNKGVEVYLIQCRRSVSMEDNILWVVHLKSSEVLRLNYGRYVSRKYLERGGAISIPDKFGDHPLCSALDRNEYDLSNFVVVKKRPSNGGDAYCYDLAYIRVADKRISIVGNGGSCGEYGGLCRFHVSTKRERVAIGELLKFVERESNAW